MHIDTLISLVATSSQIRQYPIQTLQLEGFDQVNLAKYVIIVPCLQYIFPIFTVLA